MTYVFLAHKSFRRFKMSEYNSFEFNRNGQHQAYLERQAHREANRAAYFDHLTGNEQRFRMKYRNTEGYQMPQLGGFYQTYV